MTSLLNNILFINNKSKMTIIFDTSYNPKSTILFTNIIYFHFEQSIHRNQKIVGFN